MLDCNLINNNLWYICAWLSRLSINIRGLTVVTATFEKKWNMSSGFYADEVLICRRVEETEDYAFFLYSFDNFYTSTSIIHLSDIKNESPKSVFT
jgi:hypothetical protein